MLGMEERLASYTACLKGKDNQRKSTDELYRRTGYLVSLLLSNHTRPWRTRDVRSDVVFDAMVVAILRTPIVVLLQRDVYLDVRLCPWLSGNAEEETSCLKF